MPANFAMLVPVPSTPAMTAGPPEAGLAVRVAAGPGLWEDEDWLADLRRESLPESLLAAGTIAAAAAAEHAHRQERALNAEVTALCLVTGALFPVLGYDAVLALVFGMPGPAGQARHPGPDRPGLLQGAGTVRGGPGPGHVRGRRGPGRHSRRPGRHRVRPGDHPDRRHHPGTVQLTRCSRRSSASPRPARNRCCGSSGCCTPAPAGGRPPSIGRYLDGENALADELEDAFGPGQLSLADRGFFSMDRWIRFSGAGAHLLWRVKNGAKSVPFRTLKMLKDGSELVLLRESGGMRARRRKAAGDPRPPVPAGHRRPARLLHRADPHPRAAARRPPQIRLLTTLLDPGLCPAGRLAVLYQKRWLVEIAFLHLKRTVRGTGRVLRGRSAVLVRQEAWALLLAHNMIAGLAARAAATAGLAPAQITFTAVLSLARAADHRRHLLPALRQAPGQRKRSPRRAGRRHPRPPARPRRPPADLRPHRRRTTQIDLRTSRIHPHHRPVKSPENRRKSRKLRAVGSRLSADTTGYRARPPTGTSPRG